MPELSLKVEGMNCGHCKKAVEDALKKLEGVENVQVNLEQKEVVISGTVNREQVKSKIEETGYDVVD